jgi:hypothetical protein
METILHTRERSNGVRRRCDSQASMWRAIAALIAIVISLGMSTAWGDVIHLKNGNRTEGVVESESGSTVHLLVRGSRISVPRGDILRIEPAGEGANDLIRGDSLLAQGKYDEAIRAYRYAPGVAAEVTRERIRNAEKSRDEKQRRAVGTLESSLDRMVAEDQEVALRREIAADVWPEDVSQRMKSRLADLLLEKSAAARRRLDWSEAYSQLLDAWKLAPDRHDVVLPLAKFAIDKNEDVTTVTAILLPYLREHADDMEAAELLCLHEWERAPFDVLAVLCPGGHMNPRATAGMLDLLPKVLLACFRAQPYPADAPFDRAGCYERYLAVVPKADRRPLYEARMQQEPRNPRHPFDLATYLIGQGKLAEARNALLDVQELDPSYNMVAAHIENLDATVLKQKIATLERVISQREVAFRTLAAVLQKESAVDSGTDLAQARDLLALLARRPVRGVAKSPTVYCAELELYRDTLERALPDAVAIAFHIRTQRDVAVARQRTVLRDTSAYSRGAAYPGLSGSASGASETPSPQGGSGTLNGRRRAGGSSQVSQARAPSRPSSSAPSASSSSRSSSSTSACPGGG